MPSPTQRTTSARLRIKHLTQADVDEATARGLDLSAIAELAVYQCLDPANAAGPAPTRVTAIYLMVSKERWDSEWAPAAHARGLNATEYATLGLYRYLNGQFTPPRATRISGAEGFRTSLRLPEHLLDATAQRMAALAAVGVLPKPARVVGAFLSAAFQAPADANTE
jgi:hypothetical protein